MESKQKKHNLLVSDMTIFVKTVLRMHPYRFYCTYKIAYKLLLILMCFDSYDQANDYLPTLTCFRWSDYKNKNTLLKKKA